MNLDLVEKKLLVLAIWNPIEMSSLGLGEVKLDALPYVDQGYDDPGIREAVR